MSDIDEVSIDIRDVDYTWYEGVRAYFDRDYFPREAMERLGEHDPDTGDAWLIDGLVEATADEIEVNAKRLPVCSVGCSQLGARPSGERA